MKEAIDVLNKLLATHDFEILNFFSQLLSCKELEISKFIPE